MKIETKYATEDEVYILYKDQVIKGTINKIKIEATFEATNVKYELNVKDRKTPIVATEKELFYDIDSLLEKIKEKFEKENNDNDNIN